MARVLVIGVVAALVFTVFAIVDCALMERSRVRGMPKWAWIVLSVVLPVLGGILWFVIGRGPLPRPEARVIGPDDDPSFLRSRRPSGPPAREPDAAEWLEFEQELANLDADPDDDADTGRR